MAATIPARISIQSKPAVANLSNCLLMVKPKAPIMAGIESINENLKAFSRFIPSKSAVAIVVPLLDMPGIMAMPCAVPIRTAAK